MVFPMGNINSLNRESEFPYKSEAAEHMPFSFLQINITFMACFLDKLLYYVYYF